ncbi:GFA family protein [uncultured Tateyamaria sp.]|uniref:GFA family protein n=1 Tax=Tateyamaria sp. 1078 TaxID=3417464 RepID=UPI00263644BC|nr:GFA family protein [uncultured Tateyamaria sp.]
MTAQAMTGGCQCGAVRFSIGAPGPASICHCRMCQKAFGNLFATLIEARDVTWTRGAPSIFRSSDRNWRGFCKDCGTPLTYEFDGHIEIAVGALDDPDAAQPQVQVNARYQRRCFAGLAALPEKPADLRDADDDWNASVVSYQHPDHDT